MQDGDVSNPGELDEDDNHYSRSAKRARQACLGCRRKKVRCSGERPVCAYCARLNQNCSYADAAKPPPYACLSAQLGLLPDPVSLSATTVVSKLHSIEHRLDSLESSIQSLISAMIRESSSGGGNAASSEAGICQRYPVNSSQHIHFVDLQRRPVLGPDDDLPISNHVLLSAADLYFRYCHNQPYSLFHEASFRKRLAATTVPRYLCLAFLATARRYSGLDHLQIQDAEGVSARATEAWNCIVLPWTTEIGNEAAISIVQAILLLSVIDYTDGRCSAAWIKLGLGIRIAQYYRLDREPSQSLEPWEREERRRVFWSLYLLDKLMSCCRDRSPAIRDEDCQMQLPSDDLSFRKGSEPEAPPPTLDALVGDSPTVTSLAATSHFALVILMASTLNRVARYVLQGHGSNQHTLPWSSTSQYAALESTLLQLELNYGIGEPVESTLKGTCMTDGSVDQQIAGPLVYARALFYLSGCLLHHPFLLQQRIERFTSKVPPTFLPKAWNLCRTSAKAMNMLQEVRNYGCVTLSSFYSYCTMVTGSVHSLFAHDLDENVRMESIEQYDFSLRFLRELSFYWKSAGRMASKLERFHKHGITHRQILDPKKSTAESQGLKATALWESVDNWVPCTPSRHESPGLREPMATIASLSTSPTDIFDLSNLGPFGDSVEGYNSMSAFDSFFDVGAAFNTLEPTFVQDPQRWSGEIK